MLARKCGDRRVEASTLMQLGILAFQHGQYGVARKHYRQALDVARAIGDRSLEGGALNNLGDLERLLGNYDVGIRAVPVHPAAVQRDRAAHARGVSALQPGADAYRRGAAAESIALAEQAGIAAKPLKDRDLEAILLCVRGHALTALGEWDQAAACYRDCAAMFRELGRPTMPPEPTRRAGARRARARRQRAALGAIGEIVAHLDAGGSIDGTDDPLWIYLTCHQVLASAASPRAREFLERGHAVLQQRGEPLEPAEREAFFAKVESHREIVAAWRRVVGAAA